LAEFDWWKTSISFYNYRGTKRHLVGHVAMIGRMLHPQNKEQTSIANDTGTVNDATMDNEAAPKLQQQR